MLRHIGGIDHCALLVRDLDEAAAAFARMGFTLTPRGTHSPEMGTGNNCIMLANDYFELLGILTPTPTNQHWRDVLAVREGMSGVALRARDAEQGAAEIAARGFPTRDVLRFGRPVAMPDGSTAEARFNVFHVKEPPIPGLRIFACEHLTPGATWVPGLMDHANGARGLAAIEILVKDLASAAATLGLLFDRAPEAEPDGAMRVPTGAAPLLLLTAPMLRARYPGMDLSGLAAEGPVALAITVTDLAVTESVLRASNTPFSRVSSGLAIAPTDANGAVLSFRQG